MGTIYQRAWTILAWLGEDADNSSNAVYTLLATRDALQTYPDGKPLDVEDFKRFQSPAANFPNGWSL